MSLSPLRLHIILHVFIERRPREPQALGVLPTGMLDFSFCIRYIRHLISTDVLALDGGGHHDVSTAQSTQKPAGSLPEPTTSEGVA